MVFAKKMGTTRKIFTSGCSLLGVLTACLGVGLFLDTVPNEKLQTISSFIPMALGALGAMKVGDRYVETKEIKEKVYE